MNLLYKSEEEMNEWRRAVEKQKEKTNMTIFVDAIETIWPGQNFRSANGVRAYWIPIVMREKVLAAYRDAGIKVRIRFRGPREQSVGREMPCIGSSRTYKRTRSQAHQDCLIADATHFTVYNRK